MIKKKINCSYRVTTHPTNTVGVLKEFSGCLFIIVCACGCVCVCIHGYIVYLRVTHIQTHREKYISKLHFAIVLFSL